MGDELKTEVVEDTTTQVANQVDMAASIWGEGVSSKRDEEVKHVQQPETTKAEEVKQTPDVKQPDVKANEEIVTPDYNSFIKNELGFESVEEAKREIERLRSEKQKENEEAERLASVLKDEDAAYDLLAKRRELRDIQKLSPEDAIKLKIKYEHPDYSKAEIDDVFEESYTLPEKPEQSDIEADDDFEIRMSKWEALKDRLQRRIERDSKDARKELEKYKEQAVLPEIKKVDEADASNKQKELQDIAQARDSFLKHLDSEFKNFNGYNIAYKDKDVDVQVNYGVNADEQLAVRKSVEEMDYEQYLDERWFEADGKPKINQIMSDKYLLENSEKIFKKIVADTWGKALEHFVDNSKNISINSDSNMYKAPTTTGAKTPNEVLQESAWN